MNAIHATCPGKEYFHLDASETLAPDERVRKRTIVARQCREVVTSDKVTCVCGQAVGIHMSFRCFYCGVWFCHRCAREHFGVPADFQRG